MSLTFVRKGGKQSNFRIVLFIPIHRYHNVLHRHRAKPRHTQAHWPHTLTRPTSSRLLHVGSCSCLFSTVSILYGQVVVFLSLPSAANLFWTKWCRVFTARMRSVVTAMCHPFSGRCRDVKGEPLPPMDPPPRSRWLAHELVAVQTQLSACAMGH
jgi:hypothetical protein